MSKTEIQELLVKLRRGLELLYGEHLAGFYLIGSHARGEATPESDIDVLIVLDEITDYGQEIEHTGHLVAELSLAYGISINRVFVSASAWRHRDSPFLANAREQAKAA